MKLKNLFYISVFVVPMMLASCNGGGTSNTGPTIPTSDVPGSNSSISSNTGSSSDPKKDTGKIDYDDSPWEKSVKDMMVKYLGGNIIPFVGLNGQLDAQYVQNDPTDEYRSYIVITGGTFVPSYLETAKVEFKKYSYDSNVLNDIFTATNDYLNLGVRITSDENGLFSLRAYYFEPFDSDALTDWYDDTKANIKEYFGKYDVPFVYLGTKSYADTYEHDGKSKAVFTGGTWDDEVVTLFGKAYKSFNIVGDEEDPTHYIATKEYTNGSKVTAELVMFNNKAQLTVTLDEAFDSSMQDEWPSIITEDAKTVLNNTDATSGSGLTLPYVYLGTVMPSVSSFTTRKLSISGEIWDDSVVTNMTKAFEVAGWISASDPSVEASFFLIKDSVTYSAELAKNTSGSTYYPVLTIRSAEEYEDTGYTSWSNNNRIRQAFRKKFGGTLQSMDTYVPYVYLGASDSALYVSNEYDTNYKMVIVGGKFDERIVTDFDGKYSDANGWILASEQTTNPSIDLMEDDSNVYRVAIKEFDDGTIYTIALFSLYSGEDETACLEITKSEDWHSTTSQWSSSSTSLIASHLGSEVEIPFFYTGKDSSEIRLEEGALTLNDTGNPEYFGRVQWDAYNAFKNAGWTVSITMNKNYYDHSCTLSELYATKTYTSATSGDEKKVYVDLRFTSGIFAGTLGIEETYDKTKDVGSYSSDMVSAMKANFGDEFTFPYIYFATNYPTFESDTATNTFTIWGGQYDKRVIEEATSVFEADETYSNISSYVTGTAGEVYTLTANAAVGKNGKDTLNVTIGKSLDSGKVYAKLVVTEGFDPTDAGTEWSTSVKDAFLETLDSSDAIPYFYMGTITDIKKDATSMSGYTNLLTLTGGAWDSKIYDLATAALNDVQWTFKITEVNGAGSGTKQFHAYKFYEDGSAYRLRIYRGSNGEAIMDVYYDKKNGVGDTPTAWASIRNGNNVVNTFTNFFNGNTVPALVYSNSDTAKQDEDVTYTDSQDFSKNNNHVNIWSSGSMLPAQYVYNAMKTLENDGYTTEYTPFGKLDHPVLSATKKCDDGGMISIYYAPYKGSFEDGVNKGYDLYMKYYPNFETSNTSDKWSSKTQASIDEHVVDADVFPYFNMGTNAPRVTWQENRHELELRAYTYEEGELDKIKQKFIDGGWSMYDSYAYDSSSKSAIKTYDGHFKVDDNGHIYLVHIEAHDDSHRYFYVSVTLTVCF